MLSSAPDDYLPGPFTVTFDGSSNTQCVSIPIVDDNLVEFEELFSVSLGSANPAVLIGSPSTATVTIQDSSGACCIGALSFFFLTLALLFTVEATVSFTQPSFVAAESSLFVSVCAFIVGNLDRDVVASISTTDDTALGLYMCMWAHNRTFLYTIQC